MLILAATPIGQAKDASARLMKALESADIIAAEDTRRLRRLAADLDVTIRGRVVSHFDGNERRRTDDLIEHLRAGRSVLVVTDAGMPSVSDPGHRITAAAIAEDIPVRVLPGPSAVLAALAVSGLPIDRFCFEGFLPRKDGERDRALARLAAEERAMVFFESPRRTQTTLNAMAAAFGPERRAAVCRELTKTHEETARGTLQELIDWAQTKDEILGEITIVIAGADQKKDEFTIEELARMVEEERASGMSRRDAVDRVTKLTGAPRKQVYAAAHGARE